MSCQGELQCTVGESSQYHSASIESPDIMAHTSTSRQQRCGVYTPDKLSERILATCVSWRNRHIKVSKCSNRCSVRVHHFGNFHPCKHPSRKVFCRCVDWHQADHASKSGTQSQPHSPRCLFCNCCGVSQEGAAFRLDGQVSVCSSC